MLSASNKCLLQISSITSYEGPPCTLPARNEVTRGNRAGRIQIEAELGSRLTMKGRDRWGNYEHDRGHIVTHSLAVKRSRPTF